jgi:indole-3-glycerol phosphate synthase
MFLEEIVEVKKAEVREKKSRTRQKEMEGQIPFLPSPRDFVGALSRNAPMAVIAEIKRASPSLGTINGDADILHFAREYLKGGAAAVSILTEAHFFKGDISFLGLVKQEVSLPVLQKDFILDPFQIYEGRISGGDAVLFIAAILEREQLIDFVNLAKSLRVTPLVEIHDEDDLKKISGLDLPLVGINNRNLKTFEVDLETTLRLKKGIPSSIKVISESGIKNPKDVSLLREAGVDAVLVGEVLMRAPQPASKIKELLNR